MTPEEVAKMLGQETVQKIYDDGLSESTKEIGKAATDIIKTLRLFLAPFQVGAAYQDRFVRYLDTVRNTVPEENQIECPPSIAGPIFEKLKYIEDDNYLKNLYLNLLSRAIDKERVNEAHPAFITIIEQLSPDEALILKIVAEEKVRCELTVNTIIEVGDIPKELMVENNFPTEKLNFRGNFEMYLRHLNLLSLIDMPQYNIGEPDSNLEQRPVRIYRIIKLSSFGEMFYKACVK